MTDFFSYPQIIGYVGLLTYVLSYAFKDDRKMKTGFSVSSVFWAIHYYLINAHTAAFTTAIVCVRNLLSLKSEDMPEKKKLLFATIVSLLLVTVGFYTWAGPISLIPVLTTIVVTFSVFYTSGIKLRWIFFGVDAMWLIHAIVVSSYSGYAYAIGSLIVNGYMIAKMTKENNLKKLATI